ncbi:hypothetical protein [Chryseobacterium sp. JUb7]|uniref:hypothetical protein n=1 Tax=Chryseobacterium sp. JUb7 TaxID=2940599 RepID=UPI0021689863|nr:hypothetical protein [Chryseobacterium sp. JUb7]MCS3530094.1 hypothetical protein [Chryseobacterium sp. JUb7]
MKKKLIALAVFLIAVTVYLMFYHKEKTFTIAPANADVVILLDVKKIKRQYISSFLSHPSQWFGNKKGKVISLEKSGVKIPDFLQVFHLKNSKFSDWYSVFEIKDKQKLITFLKQKKFTDQGDNIFRKDQIFVKIEKENLILGTSDRDFKNINYQLLPSAKIDILDADELITNGIGSILIHSEENSQNLSISLNNDDIEIKNNIYFNPPTSVISKLLKTKSFFETELDAQNINNFDFIFDRKSLDSSKINHLRATAHLEQVNDTVITYSYDDDFNEIEKKTFQKIIQPNYIVSIESVNSEKTEEYFRNKKWINAQNQFTAIPFQPNSIEKKENSFEIKSTRKKMQPFQKLNENYIFVRNNELLLSSLKTLTLNEKRMISSLDYIFYGNRDQDYYVQLKFKKDELPLILR